MQPYFYILNGVDEAVAYSSSLEMGIEYGRTLLQEQHLRTVSVASGDFTGEQEWLGTWDATGWRPEDPFS